MAGVDETKGGDKRTVRDPEVLPKEEAQDQDTATAATVQAWKEVLTSEVFRDLMKGALGEVRSAIEVVATEVSKREEMRLASKRETEEKWFAANLKAFYVRGVLQLAALLAVYFLAREGIFKAEVAAPLFVGIVASLFIPPNRTNHNPG